MRIGRRAAGAALETLARPAAWGLEAAAPRRIHWRAVEHDGRSIERADGLVLQHEAGRSVWATRGHTVYRSDDGAPFERVVAVRPPVGEAWGGWRAAAASAPIACAGSAAAGAAA